MARQRSPNRDRAFEIYKEHDGNITNRAIADLLGEDEKVIAVWKNRDKWNVVQQSKERCTTKEPRPHGAPKGNKNAVGNAGGAAPEGNLNAIKHGAYQNIYAEFLPEDERELYEQMPAGADMDAEIKLLRLKIARLSNRQTTFFYDMFGNKHAKELSDEDREAGILACTKQLEKLIRTQEQNKLQREKLELEKAKLNEGGHESELADKLRGLIDELDS